MIAQELLDAKSTELKTYVDKLIDLVAEAAEQSTPLHVVEKKTWQILLDLGCQVLLFLLEVLGKGDVGETCQLADGRTVKRLDEPHKRTYVSIFGRFELSRYVYGTRKGQKIEFVPLDAKLALPNSDFSYLLQDWDQSLAMEQPFGQVKGTMKKILGLDQHVDSLETMNRQMTADVDAFELVQQVPPPEEEAAIMVQTADCKGVPIRRPADAARIDDHKPKSGPKPDRKKMATLGAVYSVAPWIRTPQEVLTALFRKPDEPRPTIKRPRPCHKRLRASLNYTDSDGEHISGITTVFGWMTDEVNNRNPDGTKPLVAIMDGQESLWDMRSRAQETMATDEILDLLHVTPRIWTAAHLFHARNSREADQFVRDRVLRVLQGDGASVIRGLRCMGTRHQLKGEKRKTLNTLCNYLQKNLHRMRYDEYLAKGYPIASGVIEGACRNVVKDRMERTGMNWTIEGAQAMLCLRCIHLSDEWDDFIQLRTEREIQRLHPNRHILDDLPWALAV